jgi:predicted transposase YdaD
MADITNPHDSCFRQLMSQPENARSFFERYLTPDLKDSIINLACKYIHAA